MVSMGHSTGYSTVREVMLGMLRARGAALRARHREGYSEVAVVRSRIRITDRDVEIIRWIGRHRVATAEQVRRRFFGRWPSRAYGRLAGLVERSLLKRDFWRDKEPAVYLATDAGLRLAGLRLSPARPDYSRIPHDLLVVDISERLLSENPGASWITEREVRSDLTRAALQKGSGRMLLDPRRGRIPDGILVLPDGRRVGLEVELSPKPTVSYATILSKYAELFGTGETAEPDDPFAPVEVAETASIPSSRTPVDGVRFFFRSRGARKRAEGLAAEKGLVPGPVEFFDLPEDP
jgi:hypothetical protein